MTEDLHHRNLRAEYISYETRGTQVLHEVIIKTTLEEEELIRRNIGEGGDIRMFNCASDVSFFIRGVGPFKDKGALFPGTVLKMARDAMKLRPGSRAWDWRKRK